MVRRFKDDNRAVVAIFGGRLAEGIDLPADLVLLVGIPFAPPTAKAQKLLTKLEEVFGDNARLYGIILPGLWSALQAAGRAVRGPEDRATILLVDDRYQRLVKPMPR